MSQRPARLSAAIALAGVLAACGDPPERWTEDGPTAAGLACQPLAPEWDCFYPWPSNFYLKPDAALPGGVRVDVPGAVLPKWRNGTELEPIDFLATHPADGFSIVPQIAVRIPGSVDTGPLVFHDEDLTRSQKEDSPTLLIDADTGELVLHFAELDMRPANPEHRALVIRPLVRLRDGHRYVVALHSLTHPGGKPVTAPSGFRRIRDDDADGDAEERIAEYYDDRIFPILEKAGVARASLQLAWDFTTETDAHVTGDMLSIREQLLAKFEKQPPAITIESIDDTPDEGGDLIAREVKGTMKVPLFVDKVEKDGVTVAALGALVHRGADGRPAENGLGDASFTVRIPKSVLEDPAKRPGRIVQYGHGFFGGHLEIKGSSVSRFAADTRSIVAATDWVGMATLDRINLAAELYTNPSRTMYFVDRTHQGMANFIALNYVLRKVLKDEAALKHGDGTPIYDAELLYYYGISQGHILGSTYVALAPAIERAALSVGGTAFGLMMSRAKPFDDLLGVIEGAVGAGAGEPQERRDAASYEAFKVTLLLQTVMDRIDNATYAPHLLKDTYPGSPPERRILMQIGIGDAQVPNLASHLQARMLDVAHLQPAPRAIHGLRTVTAPFDGSALVEFDFGVELPDVEGKPVAHDNPVHEGVRRLAPAIMQMDAFLKPGGLVEHFCEGECDPT